MSEHGIWRCTSTLLICGHLRVHRLRNSVANEPVRVVKDHFQHLSGAPIFRRLVTQPTMHHHQHKPLCSCVLFTNALDTRIFSSSRGKSNGEVLAELLAACVF